MRNVITKGAKGDRYSCTQEKSTQQKLPDKRTRETQQSVNMQDILPNPQEG